MKRYNYGLALSNSGDFQAIDTFISPGIKDSYSSTRDETFSFFVAPHEFIDLRLGINLLTEPQYSLARTKYSDDAVKIMTLILRYHDDMCNEGGHIHAEEPDTQWHINEQK